MSPRVVKALTLAARERGLPDAAMGEARRLMRVAKSPEMTDEELGAVARRVVAEALAGWLRAERRLAEWEVAP